MIFRQLRQPGRLGLSDFIDIRNLAVAIAGQPPPAVREVVRWPEKVSDFWRGVTERGLGLLS